MSRGCSSHPIHHAMCMPHQASGMRGAARQAAPHACHSMQSCVWRDVWPLPACRHARLVHQAASGIIHQAASSCIIQAHMQYPVKAAARRVVPNQHADALADAVVATQAEKTAGACLLGRAQAHGYSPNIQNEKQTGRQRRLEKSHAAKRPRSTADNGDDNNVHQNIIKARGSDQKKAAAGAAGVRALPRHAQGQLACRVDQGRVYVPCASAIAKSSFLLEEGHALSFSRRCCSAQWLLCAHDAAAQAAAAAAGGQAGLRAPLLLRVLAAGRSGTRWRPLQGRQAVLAGNGPR